ncbi:E3 ubiquitin/ISG15 ligase TRIM25-like [Leptodactylus fuscus]|uniref:E3 ubiquitin/ISG15 ligase TRIM25-like n=1 Tax=Leptodactylus fuscus TaxID=238119 RepID=UPI003F4F1E17
MASAALGLELECSVCLSTYTDPVTLRCGHNFCRVCIDQVLNTQDESGVYSCPECRAEFLERPGLQKNITLCKVVENFRSTPRDDSFICCTYCVDSPVPAVRSCLHCEASLCHKHLRAHSNGPEHVLSEPRQALEKRKCSVHKKILEYYCSEDAACICVSCCLIGEHRGHNMESLDEASEKKKKQLKDVLQKLKTKGKKTQKRVQSLEKRRRKAQEKASKVAERVSVLFIDLRRRLDNLEKEVLSEISRKKEQELQSLNDLIHNLEIKKDELSRKMRHIEELCNLTDPLTVLQETDTGDLYDPEEGEGDEDTGGHDGSDKEDTGEHGRDDEDMVGHGGGDMGGHVQGSESMIHTLCDLIRGVNVTFYVQDPADILLDVNTANNSITLSDDLKTAIDCYVERPETAEKFQQFQVMSSSNISSGRHYWDVEITSAEEWMVGMCYPSIDRRGKRSYIGDNNKSWVLGYRWFNQYVEVRHDSNSIKLYEEFRGNRFRIYVDYEAGHLSFYLLCDPIRHLHTFTATFTEPLHAVLYIYI